METDKLLGENNFDGLPSKLYQFKASKPPKKIINVNIK